MVKENTILLFFGSNYDFKLDGIETFELIVAKIESLGALYGKTFIPFPLFSKGYHEKESK